MLTKIVVGAVASVALTLFGLNLAETSTANAHAGASLSCCYEGSPCCFLGSPCCEGNADCCYEGSPCCFPGSPCCLTSTVMVKAKVSSCCETGEACCKAGASCCSKAAATK